MADGRDVQHQNGGSVIKLRAADKQAALHDARRQRLDNELLMIEDPLDFQCIEIAPAEAQNHEERSIAFGVLKAERSAERDAWQAPPAEADVSTIAHLGELQLAARSADDLLDVGTRDREGLAARFDRETWQDAERERDANKEASALAWKRFDLERAAELLDVGTHHVHADTAARNRSDTVRGGQTRLKDQVNLLRAGHFGGTLSRDEAGVHGLLGEPVAIDTATIVHDADVDRIARLTGGHGQDACFALGGCAALGRRLNAVIDGIADDVQQGITDQLDHLAVEFDLAALDLDEDLLAEFGRKVSD